MTEDVIYLPPYYPPAKPRYGSPCNGCGLCCHDEVCMIGRVFFEIGPTGPCPAITFTEGRVRCGIMLAEQRMGIEPVAQKALGAGRGCDARIESELHLPSAFTHE